MTEPSPGGTGPTSHPPEEPFRDWYSNEIWGQQAQEDDALFEVMSLQVFQAGLTWRMVLAKRDAFRNAFHGWRIDEVAAMSPVDVDRLTQDPSIIRNRKKIEACIVNAQSILAIQQDHGSFCQWFYQALSGSDLGELQSSLRKTFKFMGPEIARMWLMASGRITREEGHRQQ